MADLLEHFPGTRFNIDLKSDAAVGLLADLVERTGAHDRVCVGSFSEQRLRDFRRAGLAAGRDVVRPGGRGARPARAAAAGAAGARGPRRRAPGAAPALRGADRDRRRSSSGPTRAGRPVHVWTVDEPDGDGRAARPRRRRADDRPHRRAARRADRAAASGSGARHDRRPPRGRRRPATTRPTGSGSRRRGTGTTGPTRPTTRPCSA